MLIAPLYIKIHNSEVDIDSEWDSFGGVMTKDISYFQFQKTLGYPVFVRFENADLQHQYEPLLSTMGFTQLDEEEFKKVEIINKKTRILKIQEASLKVKKQIEQPGMFDSYGPESITNFGSYDVYRYKSVGMIVCGFNSTIWEAGVKNIEKYPLEIKTLLTRYISMALAPFGIVSFWGVPVNEGFVVMNQKEALCESIFVDIDNNYFLTQDGVQDIKFETQILRLDEFLNGRVKGMSKEELVSFLSNKTCFMSSSGLDPRIRDSIFKLAGTVEGFIYPRANFKPRDKAA